MILMRISSGPLGTNNPRLPSSYGTMGSDAALGPASGAARVVPLTGLSGGPPGHLRTLVVDSPDSSGHTEDWKATLILSPS